MQKTSGVSVELEKVFYEEFQKWTEKSYGEIIKLGNEREPYCYVVEIEDRKFPIELMFLEVNDEFLHSSLQATDYKLKKWWKRFRYPRDFMLNYWIVLKEGNTVTNVEAYVSEKLKQLIKVEYEKWSNMTYEELLKPPDIDSGYHYTNDTAFGEVSVVVTLLENNAEYLHPMIEIQGIPNKNENEKLLRNWFSELENFSYDWIVYRDGRIDK